MSKSIRDIRNQQGLNVFELARILLSYEDEKSPDYDETIRACLIGFSEIWSSDHVNN